MLNAGYREFRKSRMDWLLMWAVMALVVIGTICVFSAAVALPYHAKIIRTQLIAFPVAAVFFMLGWGVNYQIFQDQWKIVYGLMIAALIGVLLFGVVDRGAKSWYRLPFFSIQPSEMCRIGLILVLANYLDRRSKQIKEVSTILGALGLAFPIFLLIMKQPDFSALLVIFPTLLAQFFCAGASLFHLSVILGYGFVAAILPILWTLISLNKTWALDNPAINIFMNLSQFGFSTLIICAAIALAAYISWWLSVRFRSYIPNTYFIGAALVVMLGFISGIAIQHQMKEYQRKRFEVFLSPEMDPRGAGYNLLQAQIAMGSGGMWGKGIFSGTQSRLGFVPERHTDFILAVVGEEMGFWGSILVLGLYLVILWRITLAAQVSRDKFGYLVNCGIFSMFMVYLFINFGMAVGLVPVAGIPLPFLSYGGSNLVATMLAVGIAQSVYSKRYALV